MTNPPPRGPHTPPFTQPTSPSPGYPPTYGPPPGYRTPHTPPNFPPGHPVRNPNWTPPPRSTPPTWLWLVLGAVLAVGVIGGLVQAVTRDEPVTLALPADPAARTARLDHLSVTVTKVETGASSTGNDGGDEDADGEFVFLTVHIENVGTFGQTFYDDDHYLIDDRDRHFDADEDATRDFNRDRRIELQPGFETTRVLAFDVPEGTTPVAVSFDPGFMTPHVRIELR
ncbi:DUF4352 domain-containing protein [Nocardia takedensis]